jgi:hypothetical protein
MENESGERFKALRKLRRYARFESFRAIGVGGFNWLLNG